MKNIKIYFIITLIMLSFGSVFIACSADNPQLNENEQPANVTTANKEVMQTICDIAGATVVNSGNATVTPGSTASYTYTNNTGTAGNVVWTISASPAGSATIISNGLSVTINYAANFVSGSLSAGGSGGTAQSCNTVLSIATSAATCCNPSMRMTYVCRGSSSNTSGGFVLFKMPAGCTWSSVSKIEITNLSGAKFVDGPLDGVNRGTINGPITSNTASADTYALEFYRVGPCLSQIVSTAKIYFNNGSPTILLNAQAMGNM